MPDDTGPLDRFLSRRVFIGALAAGLGVKVAENLVRGNLPLAAKFAVALTLAFLLYAAWPMLESGAD